jgi:hypothetical protein
MVMESPRNLKPVLAKLKEEHHVEVSMKTLQRFLKSHKQWFFACITVAIYITNDILAFMYSAAAAALDSLDS